MKLPKYVEAALGSDEVQILKAINFGLHDETTIHLLTGIPKECINRKIIALVNLKLVERKECGYCIPDKEADFLSHAEEGVTS